MIPFDGQRNLKPLLITFFSYVRGRFIIINTNVTLLRYKKNHLSHFDNHHTWVYICVCLIVPFQLSPLFICTLSSTNYTLYVINIHPSTSITHIHKWLYITIIEESFITNKARKKGYQYTHILILLSKPIHHSIIFYIRI